MAITICSNTVKYLNTFIMFNLFICCSSHGSMLEPPSRASMWKFGFPTPADYEHTQSFCGGFQVQHHINGGKCGICGDPWDETPRQHEAPGGKFASGIITRSYKPGQVIDVTVDLTANHFGYFVFKLCSNNNTASDPDQSCFEDLLLEDGRRELDVGSTRGEITARVQLPWIWCSQCILQWTYTAANNWGECQDGTEKLGCGPQETFRTCADVSILGSSVDSQESRSNTGFVNGKESHSNKDTTNSPTTSREIPSITLEPVGNQLPPGDCVAVGPWTGSLEVGEWCQINCQHASQPYCPDEMCKCGQQVNHLRSILYQFWR